LQIQLLQELAENPLAKEYKFSRRPVKLNLRRKKFNTTALVHESNRKKSEGHTKKVRLSAFFQGTNQWYVRATSTEKTAPENIKGNVVSEGAEKSETPSLGKKAEGVLGGRTEKINAVTIKARSATFNYMQGGSREG